MFGKSPALCVENPSHNALEILITMFWKSSLRYFENPRHNVFEIHILLHSKKAPIVPKKSSPGKVMPQPKYPSSTLQALHSEG